MSSRIPTLRGEFSRPTSLRRSTCAGEPRSAVRRVRRGCLLLAAVLVASLSAGCISIDLLGDGADQPLSESVVHGKRGPKILLLDIDGMISGGEAADSLLNLGTESMVARVREVLDHAREDSEVRGVLVRIDSPGGTATASEQVYTEIMRFKQERGVPVVAQLLTTAASGGYYIAMAADTVQAHPTTVTGSIGVIFSSLNFAGLMEKVGVEDQTITGGEFKDVGSPFRPLRAEERQQLQAIVDDLHDRFREIVALGRPELSRAEIDVLANGRIYSARQALANGLVDRLGTLDDAVKLLEEKIGLTESRVVAYHRSRETRRNLYTRAGAGRPMLGRGPAAGFGTARASGQAFGGSSEGAAVRLADLLQRPGFHYLWWPGLLSAEAGY